MSDEKLGTTPTEPDSSTAPALSAAEANPPISAGLLLREARAASGMHIATLSMALKVSVKKLEALEADDWAQLPDAVFVRALATSVCRHIKTDSAPILAALPQSAVAKLIDDQASKGLNQTFRNPSDPKPSLLRLPISVPMVLGALVLLLAAVVLIFLPDFVKKQEVKKAEIIETVMPSAQTTMASTITIPVEVASMPAVPNTVATTPPASMATPAPAPISASASVTPASASTLTPGSASAILRMTAKGLVWIEVKDNKGVVLVQRTMQPKEVVNVSGQPPLAVVVGRINEMQAIEVRGKPFSLAGLSPDNVARFEVK